MAKETVTKTIFDAIDEFRLSKTCAESLTHILSDMVDDTPFSCTLEVIDPCHPVQRMYACITSIQHQLKAIETIVESMPSLAGASM